MALSCHQRILDTRMPVKTFLRTAAHLACLSAIALLAGFIFREKMSDRDALLQGALQKALNAAQVSISGNEVLKKVKELSLSYPSPNCQDYCHRAENIHAQADSVLLFIEKADRYPHKKMLAMLQTSATSFLHQVQGSTDDDTWVLHNVKTILGKRPLFQPHRTHFLTHTAQARAQVALLEYWAMDYFLSKVSGSSGLSFEYNPCAISQIIGPMVGDTVTTEVMLGGFSPTSTNTSFKLNGQPLEADKYGIVPFSLRYDRPGLYPLHLSATARDWETDSVLVCEKTYYLRVR